MTTKILIFLCFILVTLHCKAQQDVDCFTNANRSKFQFYIDSCDNEYIIDVRIPKRYQSGSIPMAINAPTKDDLLNLIDQLDRDTPILIYCTEGTRSIQACNIICTQGFTFVINLKEGFAK